MPIDVRLRVVLLTVPGGAPPWDVPTATAQVATAAGAYATIGVNLNFNGNVDLATMPDPLPYNADTQGPSATQDAQAASADWSMRTGVLNLYLREGDGGESDIGNGYYAIALKALGVGGQNQISHEIGHGFGLHHTFNESYAAPLIPAFGLTLEDGANFVEASIGQWLADRSLTIQTASDAQWAEATAYGQAALQNLFDGDRPDLIGAAAGVTDTPATIQDWPVDGFADPPPANVDPTVGAEPVSLTVNTNLKRNGQPQTFSVAVDRTNIMSYFGANPDCKWISPQQGNVIRTTILSGNGNHLLGPALQWSGWESLGGNTSGAPGTAWFGGPFYVISAQGQGLQYTSPGSAAPPFTWESLNSPGALSGAACQGFDSKMYVFGIDQGTGKIYWSARFQNQEPLPFAEIPGNGAAKGSPCAAMFQNRLYVSVLGPTGRFFFTSSAAGNSPANQWSGQWIEFSGGGSGIAAPALAAWGSRLYAFVPGNDNKIYFNWSEDGATFQPAWAPLPGSPNVPSFETTVGLAAATVNNFMMVFAVRPKDGALVYNASPFPGEYSGWVPIPGGGQTGAAPAVEVGSGPGGRVRIVVKGLGGTAVWQTTGTLF